jgi:hypothetical protein
MDESKKGVSKLEQLWEEAIEVGMIYDDTPFRPLYFKLYTPSELGFLLKFYGEKEGENEKKAVTEWISKVIDGFIKIYKVLDEYLVAKKSFRDLFYEAKELDLFDGVIMDYDPDFESFLSREELTVYIAYQKLQGVPHPPIDRLGMKMAKGAKFLKETRKNDEQKAITKIVSTKIGKDPANIMSEDRSRDFNSVFWFVEEIVSLPEYMHDEHYENLENLLSVGDFYSIYMTIGKMDFGEAFYRILNMIEITQLTSNTDINYTYDDIDNIESESDKADEYDQNYKETRDHFDVRKIFEDFPSI